MKGIRTDVEVGEDDVADALDGLGGLVRVVVADRRLERGLVPGKVVACVEEVVETLHESCLRDGRQYENGMAWGRRAKGKETHTLPPMRSMRCAVSWGANQEYSQDEDS